MLKSAKSFQSVFANTEKVEFKEIFVKFKQFYGNSVIQAFTEKKTSRY